MKRGRTFAEVSRDWGETRAINKPRQKEMKAHSAMYQNFGVQDFSSDF